MTNQLRLTTPPASGVGDNDKYLPALGAKGYSYRMRASKLAGADATTPATFPNEIDPTQVMVPNASTTPTLVTSGGKRAIRSVGQLTTGYVRSHAKTLGTMALAFRRDGGSGNQVFATAAGRSFRWSSSSNTWQLVVSSGTITNFISIPVATVPLVNAGLYIAIIKFTADGLNDVLKVTQVTPALDDTDPSGTTTGRVDIFTSTGASNFGLGKSSLLAAATTSVYSDIHEMAWWDRITTTDEDTAIIAALKLVYS